MTQEEKDLLLKDLCARLPYGVMVKDRNGIHKLTVGNTEFTDLFYSNKCNIKPYLRPMSSMTEKEKNQFDKFVCIDEDAWIGKSIKGYINQSMIMSDGVDWLNKHHFDHRGLIEKGLAIEVTEDNNPYKDKS